MLPMGTIVTVCMFVGVLLASGIPLFRSLPRPLMNAGGGVVLLAGLWNTLWYGLQNFSEFWGFAALVSGILMIVTAVFILNASLLPESIRRLKPLVLVILTCYAVMYAVTIARL